MLQARGTPILWCSPLTFHCVQVTQHLSCNRLVDRCPLLVDSTIHFLSPPPRQPLHVFGRTRHVHISVTFDMGGSTLSGKGLRHNKFTVRNRKGVTTQITHQPRRIKHVKHTKHPRRSRRPTHRRTTRASHKSSHPENQHPQTLPWNQTPQRTSQENGFTHVILTTVFSSSLSSLFYHFCFPPLWPFCPCPPFFLPCLPNPSSANCSGICLHTWPSTLSLNLLLP